MADLTKIFTGMDKGPEAIMDNFNKLNINWTDWSNEGIVFQNGFQNYQTFYRYAQIGNAKLIELKVSVTLSSAPAGNSAIAFQVPSSIAPQMDSEHAESSKYQWLFNVAGEFHINIIDSGGWWTGEGSHYIMNMVYVHKN